MPVSSKMPVIPKTLTSSLTPNTSTMTISTKTVSTKTASPTFPEKIPPVHKTLTTQASSRPGPIKEASKTELRQTPQPIQKLQPIQNRVQVLLVHIPKFSIQGQARLAAEVGVSRSTISRLVHGRINPSYRLARGVTDALERALRKPLDMREVFSTDGTYLTPSGCTLCQCGGCMPDQAYDPEGNLRREWQGQRPGDWSLARAAEVGLADGANTAETNLCRGKEAR